MSRPLPFLLLLCAASAALRGAETAPAQSLALTLAEAQAQAVRNHPRLAAAQIEALIANEGIRAAQAPFFPTIQGYLTAVDAGNENTRILAGGLNNPSIYDRAAAGLGISEVISDFGHTSNLAQGAKLQARAQAQNTAATREQVMLGVDIAYFTTLQARAVLKVARQTLSTEQLLADRVKALASNQLKSELDVSFAMVGLEQAQLVMQKAQGDDGAAQADLSAALGLQGSHQFELADVPAAAAEPGDGASLVATALHERPDLVRLRLERDAAAHFARAEHDSNNPTVSVVGAIGDSPSHDVHVPEHYAAAGVQMSLPIFEGGLYLARERQADLRTRIAEENLRDAEDTAARDVQVAWLNLGTASQRFRTAEQLVLHADKAFQLAQARYQQGSSSIVELSEAQLNATSADMTLASARYDVLIQRSILDYQTGLLRD